MNIFNHLRSLVIAGLDSLGPAEGLDFSRVSVDPPRDAAHGDAATNAAMVLAKAAGMTPRDLAGALAAKLAACPEIAGVEVAGPGFINLRLTEGFVTDRLRDVLAAGVAYGDSALGQGRAVNVEYVSTNPTGPLHVGHCRGAVVGDVLAALLEKAGYAVTREYYVNDAGAQVDTLARSLHLRYREALGEDIGEIPEGLYPGAYLVEVAKALVARDGDKWRTAPETAFLPALRRFAVAELMEIIKSDLKSLGVVHDVFSSEQALVESGAVQAAFGALQTAGHIYVGVLEPPKGKKPDDWEPRAQTLFKATAFGDDVDRPLKKSDGSWTYFATDIAYHADKARRGHLDMIDILGADHGGYVTRMQAAVKAITQGQGALDAKICQLVKFIEKGRPIKMSKRSGNFIALRDVIDKVGKDVIRFIMLTRKNDAPLDFDFAKVQEQSRDNPVFYVQYAHARICSVFRQAAESLGDVALDDESLAKTDLSVLNNAADLTLIKKVTEWPRVVEQAAKAHEPHRIAMYLQELAAEFHQLWNKGRDKAELRFILTDEVPRTQARLAMIRAVALTIASGLAVLGVTPVEEMR